MGPDSFRDSLSIPAGIFGGVDLNDFWGYQQDMIAGKMSAKKVLQNWDVSFSGQMRDKEMPGCKLCRRVLSFY